MLFAVSVIAQAEIPSTIVAVTLLVLVGTIMVVGILKYNTVDEAIKLWSGLGPLVGLIVGIMGTYFFTRDIADARIAKVEAEKSKLTSDVTAATQLKTSAETELAKARVHDKAVTDLGNQLASFATKSGVDIDKLKEQLVSSVKETQQSITTLKAELAKAETVRTLQMVTTPRDMTPYITTIDAQAFTAFNDWDKIANAAKKIAQTKEKAVMSELDKPPSGIAKEQIDTLKEKASKAIAIKEPVDKLKALLEIEKELEELQKKD